MIEQLFGSKTRVKLLKLFYGNPNRAFYVREITRKIDEQINSVRRELSNLLNIGIITSDTTNNKLYYEVNQKYIYYDPFLSIFGPDGVKPKTAISKPQGEVLIENEFKNLGHVNLIIFSGQFTRDSSSPVDVLIVGDVNKNAVDKYISSIEADEGKNISYTVLTVDDFLYRRQIHDRFITRFLSAKKQVIIDTDSIFKD